MSTKQKKNVGFPVSFNQFVRHFSHTLKRVNVHHCQKLLERNCKLPLPKLRAKKLYKVSLAVWLDAAVSAWRTIACAFGVELLLVVWDELDGTTFPKLDKIPPKTATSEFQSIGRARECGVATDRCAAIEKHIATCNNM